MLKSESILRSEVDVLRLERISRGGSDPRPRMNSIRVPWKPEKKQESISICSKERGSWLEQCTYSAALHCQISHFSRKFRSQLQLLTRH